MGKFFVGVQFYNDKNEERNKENLHCLKKNLDHPYIDQVHVLLESHTIFPEELKNHPKCIIKDMGPQRLTFQAGFSYFEPLMNNGDFAALMNSDIILDRSSPWDKLETYFNLNPGRIAIALTRHEINQEKNTWQDPNVFAGWSQDVWILQKNHHVLVPPLMLSRLNFCVGGCPRCDNYFVVLARNWGNFDVINPALKLKVLHYDRCRGNAGAAMVFTDQTDYRAREAMDRLVPFLGHVDNLCPFIDYEKCFHENNLLPLNKVANCWKRSPHIHLSDGNIQEDVETTKIELEKLWKGISDPSVTLKEKNSMSKVAIEIMHEKQCFFEPPVGWEEWTLNPVQLYCYWVNQLRFTAQWEKALELLKRACACENVLNDDYSDYQRYHLLGIVGWYAKDFVSGKWGAQKALENKNQEVDQTNLQFYP